jgi:P4 family phage/plasmid primase-like protien
MMEQPSFGPMDEIEVNIIELLASDKPESEKRGALIEEILNRIIIRTLRDTGEILFYDPESGIYRRGGEEKIREELFTIGAYEINNARRSEVIATIKDKTGTDRQLFDKSPEWLHVNNGWLNIDNLQFKDHSDELPSLSKLPVDYDPQATNPEQKRFFSEIFEPEDLDAVQKFFGYLLIPDNRFKKAFILVGPKDTGKSKFLELVEKFAGNVSHVSLHDMAAHNHNVETISRSTVNTTSELPKYRLKDVSLFKGTTGGDELSFREIYRRPYSARVRAKFLMAANELPDFDGMDQTFIDRWIVFRFSNVFKMDEDMDVNILEKVSTPVEMSGLINYALEGRAKLINDGFFKNEDYNDLKEKWAAISSKLGEFKEKHLITKEGATIQASVLYDYYCKHTDKPLSTAIFGREMKKLGIPHKQIREGGRRRWIYEDITVTGDLGNLDIPLLCGESGTIEEGDREFPVTPKTEGTT